MNINEVSGNNLSMPGFRSKKYKEENPVEAVKKDRVEVSNEARTKYVAEQKQRLQEIQQRIVDGFYSRQDVLEQVVDALLKDIAR